MADRVRTVSILLFDDVEVLDFCGPYEVFSVAVIEGEYAPFQVELVGTRTGAIRARNGMSVNPDRAIGDGAAGDILIVPGGNGTRALLDDDAVLDWVRTSARRAELVLSVCTGSLVLARAGLLRHLPVTTHHTAFDLLERLEPTCRVERGVRYVDTGATVTAAGISAGIDMSLHVVSRLVGEARSREVAGEMEYEWDQARHGAAPAAPHV